MEHQRTPSRRPHPLLAGLAALAAAALALPATAGVADAADRPVVVLTGVVTDATGAPVVGACPRWGSSLCGSGEVTDSTGTFRRQLSLDDSVDAAVVTVVPASDDLMHAEASLTLTRAAGWKATLTVPAYGVLRGVALDDATGRPVAGVCPLTWESAAGGTAPAPRCSGSDGAWTMGLLTPGVAYAVSLRSDVLADSFVPTGLTYTGAAKTTVVADKVTSVATTRLKAGATLTAGAQAASMQLVLRPVDNANDLVTHEVDALPDPVHPGTFLGIEPGTYEARLEANIDCDLDCDSGITTAGAPVWYPGTFDPAGARQVTLASGQNVGWAGPLPAFAHVTAVVKGLPKGSRVGFTAFFPSGTEVPYRGGWESGTNKKALVGFLPTLPPVPLKIRLTARKADGTTLTWWYGGSNLSTAKLVKPNTTVRVTAPKK